MSSLANGGAPRAGGTGERALIERIRQRVPAAPASLLVGIGDDAAVAAPARGAFQVLTTDTLVEGVHFDWRFSSPADVGHKALAVSISDIAAMGGAAELALLSLMLPADTPVAVVDGILDGLLALAAAHRVALAGGNITRTPGPLVLNVTLTGSVKPRKILRRSGARPGDQLYVTGSIGGAAAGLAWLQSAGPLNGPADAVAGGGEPALAEPDDPAMAACVLRHRRPEPRARIGALLGRTRAASACMDLSDGLADALAQVCEASGAGALIDGTALPIAPGAAAWFAAGGTDPIKAALAGGDDYELLFAVPKRRRGRLRSVIGHARGVSITRIGEVTTGRSIEIEGPAGRIPLPTGFDHFS